MSLASNRKSSPSAEFKKGERYSQKTFQQKLIVSKAEVISRLTGTNDENLHTLEERFPIRLNVRGEEITIEGPDESVVVTIADFLRQRFMSAQSAKDRAAFVEWDLQHGCPPESHVAAGSCQGPDHGFPTID